MATFVNVLFYEDLRDVILVGHSYGGNVITGAADRGHNLHYTAPEDTVRILTELAGRS